MSSSSKRWLWRVALVVLAVGTISLLPGLVKTGYAVSGGANTTALTAGACLNGSQVNCNNYASKADVYLSGNPSQLTAGTFFYAVVDPGGQPNPNDGAPKNLSSSCDTYTNREFTVSSTGAVTPVTPTTHNSQFVKIKGAGGYSNTFIQVGDPTNSCYFANTANPGGVYILAVCLITSTYNPVTNPVHPSDCKYDAFKVKQTSTTLSYVLSGTKFLDTDLDGMVTSTAESGLAGWTITITNASTNTQLGSVVTDANGNWSFSGDLPAGATSLTLNVCEVMQTGWKQTGPVGTGSVTPVGSATLLSTSTAPSGNCYQVQITNGGNSVIAGLDFFNVQNTTPTCTLTASGTNTNGQAYIQVTVQDANVGLKSVQVTELVNSTGAWDNPATALTLNSFAPVTAGDKTAHVVTATKIDQTQGSNLALQVINELGNVTNCDPVQVAAARTAGVPVSQDVAGVQMSDHLLHIFNSTPGVTNVTVTVNGTSYQFANLGSGQQITVDVASALTSGTNTVTVTTTGQPGGSASVLFGNI